MRCEEQLNTAPCGGTGAASAVSAQCVCDCVGFCTCGTAKTGIYISPVMWGHFSGLYSINGLFLVSDWVMRLGFMVLHVSKGRPVSVRVLKESTSVCLTHFFPEVLTYDRRFMLRSMSQMSIYLQSFIRTLKPMSYFS